MTLDQIVSDSKGRFVTVRFIKADTRVAGSIKGNTMTQQQIRNNAASLAREIRAMWPTLAGDWTRKQWNDKARMAARQYIKNTENFQRVNK